MQCGAWGATKCPNRHRFLTPGIQSTTQETQAPEHGGMVLSCCIRRVATAICRVNGGQRVHIRWSLCISWGSQGTGRGQSDLSARLTRTKRSAKGKHEAEVEGAAVASQSPRGISSSLEGAAETPPVGTLGHKREAKDSVTLRHFRGRAPPRSKGVGNLYHVVGGVTARGSQAEKGGPVTREGSSGGPRDETTAPSNGVGGNPGTPGRRGGALSRRVLDHPTSHPYARAVHGNHEASPSTKIDP